MGKTKFENSLVRMKRGGKKGEEKYHSYRLGGKLGEEGCREEYPFLIR